MSNQTTGPIQRTVSTSIFSTFISQVYAWMAIGLLITASIAFFITQAIFNDYQLALTMSNLIVPAVIAQLALVVVISLGAGRLNAALSSFLFVLYSASNGIFFSILLASYGLQAAAIAFGATFVTFAIMALYGYTTKQDLTTFGNIAIFMLIGVIVSSVINFFAQSQAFDWVLTYLTLGIFVVLTASDTQKLKRMSENADQNTLSKYVIAGALTLYLDFINIFITLLKIFGSSSRN